MVAIDDKSALAHHSGSAIDVSTRQAPVARALLLDIRGSSMRVLLVVIVDNTTEGLVCIGASDNPCTLACRLHVKASEEGGSIA